MEDEMTNNVHLNIFYHYNEEDQQFVSGMPNECPICAQDIICPHCRKLWKEKNHIIDPDPEDESSPFEIPETNELLS